ncbi:MAG: hypothetical protein Q8P41_05700 [Pseudomonadota bacterium]|nr:hypothetical protein [Pseudomonadota bacterium]
MSLPLLLALATSALAAPPSSDTVTLRFDPTAAPTTTLRCTSDREKRQGAQTTTQHLEMRAVYTIEPVGRAWAQGAASLEVLAFSADPAPPPGTPSMDSLFARIDPILPRLLVDARGRWKGIEPVDQPAIEAALKGFLTEGGLSPEIAARAWGAMAPAFSSEGLTERMRESWYADIGHWLDRTLAVGTSELGTSKKKDPFPVGTALTWSASRRVMCDGSGKVAGAPDCVELRLEARLPAAAVKEQNDTQMATLAQAAGIELGAITFVGGSSVTTWIAVVDPDTLAARRTERRRVTDTEVSIGGRSFVMGTLDTFACVAE